MVEVQIFDKSYPLCLTVAALDEVNAVCGSLSNIGEFMDGHDSMADIGEESERSSANISTVVTNTIYMLSLLIREGENNRMMVARLAGEQTARRELPTYEQLKQLLTVRSALTYRAAIYQAVTESMNQEIEAVYQKNVKDAEQE